MKGRKEGRGNVFVCSKKRREVDNLNQARFLINKKGRSRGPEWRRSRLLIGWKRFLSYELVKSPQLSHSFVSARPILLNAFQRLYIHIYTLSTTIRVRQLQVTRTNERSSITRLDLRGELNAKNDRSIHQLSANERTVFVWARTRDLKTRPSSAILIFDWNLSIPFYFIDSQFENETKN